jgi:peptide deformylase
MNENINEFTTIKIDTESWKKDLPSIQTVSIPKFELVSLDHLALSSILPDFDFNNPPVDPNKFASSLVETCKSMSGLGLSANQCGFTHRVFVMGLDDNYVAFFNPKIISVSDNISQMEEGCLSFMDLFLKVTRPDTIDVEYQDYTGQKKTATYTGLTARCFQHELDHMNGVVYTQRVKPLALQMAKKRRSKLAIRRKNIRNAMVNKVKDQFNANKFRHR